MFLLPSLTKYSLRKTKFTMSFITNLLQEGRRQDSCVAAPQLWRTINICPYTKAIHGVKEIGHWTAAWKTCAK